MVGGGDFYIVIYSEKSFISSFQKHLAKKLFLVLKHPQIMKPDSSLVLFG